jgi:hypothetical protein
MTSRTWKFRGNIPSLGSAAVSKLVPSFVNPDANIRPWLPRHFPSNAPCEVESKNIATFLSNKGLFARWGGLANARKRHCFSLQEIHWLTMRAMDEPKLFLRNGMRNLFPIKNTETGNVYFIGLKWKPKVKKFTIHIFDADDKSRGWCKGNRIFRRALS